MLYDCRSDQLIPGTTLWDDKTLQSGCDTSPQVATDIEIMTEDSLQRKALHLNISSDLMLSFIAGLVEISGSAEYLSNRKHSKLQSRVSLKYWSTSRFDQLNIKSLGNIQYPEVLSSKIATHIVIGVLYGADVIFVFDRMVNPNENVRNVQGEVEALVKTLPEMIICEKDKEAASKIECQFHGDIQLPEHPTTFEVAVQVYQQLPELLQGRDGRVAVPKKVWLYPLSSLNNSAAKMVNHVSTALVVEVHKVMEAFLDYDIECTDLMKISECLIISRHQTQLLMFKKFILQYKIDFSKRLSLLVSSIREGRVEESQLKNLLQSNDASPFSSHNLKNWLERKRNEVKFLGKHIQRIQKVSCIEFTRDLAAVVNDLHFKCVICLCFQTMASESSQLEQMESFLTTQQFSGQINEVDSWYANKELMNRMEKHVGHFTNFAKVNERQNEVKFVVTDSLEQHSESPITILLFQFGKSTQFYPPVNISSIKQKSVTCNSITIDWSKPEYGSDYVQNYIVEYGYKHIDGSIVQWKTKKTKEKETSIIIDSLTPATSYCFKVCAVCVAGVSEFSGVSSPISTCQSPRLPEAIRNISALLHHEGELPIYKVCGKEINLPGKMLHKISVGEATPGISEKVLIVVGATGAGKSTLINGMINYIFGVQWKDNFRFKLINEESKSQAYSPTSSITAYTIYHMDGSRVEYNLTIIDTPGFGDTSGPQRDREIMQQIKEFFSVGGVSHLNGIAFVTQSALARLTTRQHYIYDTILAMFGKDVEKNIFIMVTFADRQKPPVMSAIEAAKIPHSGFFVFNNSAVFAEIREDIFDEMFWGMGMSSFKKFFRALQQTESVSLTMTKDVQQYQVQFQDIIAGLQYQVQACLVASHQRQLQEAQGLLQSTVEEAQQCLVKLDELALKPNPLREVEYIQLIINLEKQCAEDGWRKRVEYLETAKEQLELVKIMADTKDFDKQIQEEREKKNPWWEKRIERLQLVKEIKSKKTVRLAEIMKSASTQLLRDDGRLSVYKVPGKINDLPGKMLHKISVGEAKPRISEKVLIVVGAAGAGKSTLIDGMINYIFGVQWKDNFRFKLITEESKSQAYSQTSSITAYTIYHMDGSRVEYNLTIIDTPGFGDTSGPQRDKEIMQQIKEFFSVGGVSHLNGIAFVTQSALAQLTPTQQYICDTILAMFGKDVEKNIFIMVTFADGQRPPVMSAFEAAKIPHSGYFIFNNSALFAEIGDDDDDNFDEMFWRMGMKYFKRFFSSLQQTECVSITMTKDVLKLNDDLETITIDFQHQLKICLAKFEELHQEREVLRKHEKAIEMNKDFYHEVKVQYYRAETVQEGYFAANCLHCSTTCHYPCEFSDADKMHCNVINKRGNCTVCYGKCHWSKHRCANERYILEFRIVKKTDEDIKRKYDCAVEGKLAVERLLTAHQCMLEESCIKVQKMANEAQKCLVKLREKALKGILLSQVEYIELLITSERQQAVAGWPDRVKYLQNKMEQANLLSVVNDIDDIEGRIRKEERERKYGWEGRVEILQQIQRIKCEVELHR